MNNLTHLVDTTAHALGSAVVNFLWIGALIGVIAAVVLATIPRNNAPARYVAACGALLLCPITFVTAFTLALRPPPPAATGTPALPQLPALAPDLALATQTTRPGLLEHIAWLWVAGVTCLSARAAYQWLAARHLTTRHVTAPDAQTADAFDALRRSFGITQSTRLLQSSIAQVPMVVGWLKPVVIVPASAFTSLTPDQLRAVLAHELAHIRRHDHLLNAAQVLVETALFFYPVTWWLSRHIRTEREHRCDTDTVRTIANPRVFAEALTRLETIRSHTPQPTLAATGGPLMDRIARILGTNAHTRPTPPWRAGLAIAAATITAAVGITHAAAGDAETHDNGVLRILQQFAAADGVDHTQLRNLYNMLVFDGSQTDRALDERLAAVRARVDAAVTEGALSHERAQLTIEKIQDEHDFKAEIQFFEEVYRLTPDEAQIRATRLRLESALERGELSADEAADKARDIDADAETRQRFAQAVAEHNAEVKAAVEAGEITPEQARKAVHEFEQSLKLRSEYVRVEHKLNEMIKAGEITPDQAKLRLNALRDRLGEVKNRKGTDWEARKARVEAAVERGDISRDEADRIYRDMKNHEKAHHREHDRRVDAAKQIERDHADQRHRRVSLALADAGLAAEKTRVATEAVFKAAELAGAKDAEFALAPDVAEWLQGEGFTADDIELVAAIAERLASAKR